MPVTVRMPMSLPAINNINAVLNTGFERWEIETDLTAYVPITERSIVPIVLISRSQTSVALYENLSLSLVVDARTYLHKDGAELSFKPLGAITYQILKDLWGVLIYRSGAAHLSYGAVSALQVSDHQHAPPNLGEAVERGSPLHGDRFF